MWCLGAAGTVGQLSRFLQEPEANQHATLLTLFLNAIPEEMTQQEDQQDMNRDLGKAMNYVPLLGPPQGMGDPRMLMLMEARSLLRDNDKYFDRSVSY